MAVHEWENRVGQLLREVEEWRVMAQKAAA
jgi:type IV secretory pathway TrbF-like protein